MTICRELSEECIRSHLKRNKFVEVPMGLLAEVQLMVAQHFYVAMIYLYWPMKRYLPSYGRETKNRPALQSQLYIMVLVCTTTKIVNLETIEGKTSYTTIGGFKD